MLKDFEQLNRWSKARGKSILDPIFFPVHGFIADDIACGFLYLTDSAVGIIDNYYSNPESDSFERSKALDSITMELIRIAKANDCRLIKCDTKIEAVKSRALKHGFRALGSHDSFAKEI